MSNFHNIYINIDSTYNILSNTSGFTITLVRQYHKIDVDFDHVTAGTEVRLLSENSEDTLYNYFWSFFGKYILNLSPVQFIREVLSTILIAIMKLTLFIFINSLEKISVYY